MIPGSVFLVAVKLFLIEHRQVKTLSPPSRQQIPIVTIVPIVTIIKKGTNSDNNKENLLSLKPSDLVIINSDIINSITFLQKKTVTLKTPNSMTLTKIIL